jgi:hypothetical protein
LIHTVQYFLIWSIDNPEDMDRLCLRRFNRAKTNCSLNNFLHIPHDDCNTLMYYLKHEQQCFIRYKDTRRSRVSLGLIKHALRMFYIAKNTMCKSRKSREISITYKDTTHAYDFSLCSLRELLMSF